MKAITTLKLRERLNQRKIEQFAEHLSKQEKASATISKYIRDVKRFYSWLDNEKLTVRKLTKNRVMEYKEYLSKELKPASVNSMLISLNKYFEFRSMGELKVKTLRLQKKTFSPKEKELTKAEYERLLKTAGKNSRLYLVIETICATGIRVSELKYITAEAVMQGKAEVFCKAKVRVIMIPKKLRSHLKEYICEKEIASGSVFVTRSGKPLDRSNIWSSMKALCEKAKVAKEKVFPHNLRHLFAKVFYSVDKDIARLADLLGHSSIETTRIYIRTSGSEHIRQLEKMGLVT